MNVKDRKRKFLLYKDVNGYVPPGYVPEGAEGWDEAKRQAHNAQVLKAVKKSQPPADTGRDFDVQELYRPHGAQIQVEDSSAADAENERLAARLESFAGTTEDVTRRPAYAIDSFLHGDIDPDGGAPRPLGYAVVEDPGIAPPEQTFMDGGLRDLVVQPENFAAPKPQPTRLGSGYVMKGLFTDLVYGTTSEEAAAAVAKSRTQGEPSLADILGLAK